MNDEPTIRRELGALLARLWSNWAFRLSLSSNELFHSNILQFFAETAAQAAPPAAVDETPASDDESAPGSEARGGGPAPQRIDARAAEALLRLLCKGEPRDDHEHAALSRLRAGKPLTVHREWKRMDLVVVQTDGKQSSPVFALEIKVKAYPTAGQLRGYRDALRADASAGAPCPPLFLLTGMGAEQAAAAGVPALTFGDLAQSLGHWALDESAQAVQREYVALCALLHALFARLSNALGEGSTLRGAIDIAALLVPYRLHSLWWKLWASHLEALCAQGETVPGAQPHHLSAAACSPRIRGCATTKRNGNSVKATTLACRATRAPGSLRCCSAPRPTRWCSGPRSARRATTPSARCCTAMPTATATALPTSAWTWCPKRVARRSPR